ncbi:unnamed protein product, partial [Hapterophycus canaliculatus]
QCWCGSNADYDVNGEGLCNILCAGAIDGEYCGGVYAMSVYENDETDNTIASVDIVGPTDTSFLGCFSDPTDSRVFLVADSSTSSSMTAELCLELCADFAFYGTQYANECWCGSNADYDANGAGICDMICAGSSGDGEICGGVYAMSIYENNGSDTATVAPVDPTGTSFLGCYSDPAASRVFLEADSFTSSSMTAELCLGLCAEFPLYGTQYAIECWCGTNTDYGANGAGVCDMVCAGTSDTEICGGVYAMSVYENNAADTTAPTYLGCWSDPRGVTRVMSDLVASTDDMTAEVCAVLCASSTFFGTQYGVECWCGDAFTDYDANGEAICDYECAGDTSETCGGFEAISVYELA